MDTDEVAELRCPSVRSAFEEVGAAAETRIGAARNRESQSDKSEKMSQTPSTAEFRFDRWSLCLFVTGVFFLVAGILLPGTGSVSAEETNQKILIAVFAVSLGVVAECLALIFGILGRRSAIGMLGLMGSILSLALFALLVAMNVRIMSNGRPEQSNIRGPSVKSVVEEFGLEVETRIDAALAARGEP